MNVLLHDVAGVALKRLIAYLAVDKHAASDYAGGYATCEGIEQRRLTRTGDSLAVSTKVQPPSQRAYHKSCETTRFDPSINRVQNLARLALDLHVVTNVFPVKDRVVLLDLDRQIFVAESLASKDCGSSTSFFIDPELFHFAAVHLGPAKYQDLAFRARGRDQLRCNEMDDK
jgi:hypothetical protein